jgi:hypothetical protein
MGSGLDIRSGELAASNPSFNSMMSIRRCLLLAAQAIKSQKSIMNGSSPEAQHLCRYLGHAGNREDHQPGDHRFGEQAYVRCSNFLPDVDFAR